MANPTLLDMPIARDGNKNAIPTTDNGTTGLLSQQYGWQLINAIPPQQGGKAVKREDFNGALYLLSNLLFYLQKGFTFEYNETQDYYKNCIVLDPTNGKMYRAKNDASASATHPSADSTNWELFDLPTLLANYLPLAGGTMTGAIFTGNNPRALVGGTDISDTSRDVGIYSTWDGLKGANINLCAKDYSGNPGCFILTAGNGVDTQKMVGFPDGRLTWAGNDLAGNAIKSKSIGAALGYKITADGLHLEYGRQAISASTPTEITFGVSFNGGYCAAVTPSSGTASVGHTNLTKMTITTSNTVYVDWIAIGQ